MKRPTPIGYELKFSEFIKLCEDSKAQGVSTVIIASPLVIGDTYEEVIESLSRLATHGLSLQIANSQ
jgi:hypothetical protein